MYEIREQSRVATGSIAGYRYQLLHTLRAWLELQDDEWIVAEGNEDIDRWCLHSNTQIEEQVKHSTAAFTQGHRAITETVLHYLEAFAYHKRKGRHFRGVLRTNVIIKTKANTAIKTWILGQDVDVAKFRSELRKLVRAHAPNLKDALRFVLSTADMTRMFIDSVEWASDSPNVDAVLSNLLATRAPGVNVQLTRDALLSRLLKSASSSNPADRSLRRIDADIALTDCALDKLQETAMACDRTSRAVIWSKAGPPSVAVALLFESANDAMEAAAKKRREECLGDRSRVDSLRALTESLEFIGYASVRYHSGPKGEHVCVKDVVRQSAYRHCPKQILLRQGAPNWIRERASRQWRNATYDVDRKMSLLLELAELIGVAILAEDGILLKRLGTKLRWVHVIDELKYYTADNPLVVAAPSC